MATRRINTEVGILFLMQGVSIDAQRVLEKSPSLHLNFMRTQRMSSVEEVKVNAEEAQEEIDFLKSTKINKGKYPRFLIHCAFVII